MLNPDEMFMQEALKAARTAEGKDEVPVGAIIVYNKQIIARAHNQVELLKDPTAHAEMIAITSAASHLSSKWLLDCTLFVTLEPCAMCAGAIVLARFKRVCFGARDPKAGAGGSILNVLQNPQLNHRPEVSPGICGDECGDLLSEYFKKKREMGKK